MRDRTQTLRAPLAALVALLCFNAAAPAAAAEDEAQAEAKLRFKRGSKLYDEGNFREAAREFEAGYALYPRPGFLVNIGHSYRRSGDLRTAKRYYEMFLNTPDGDAAQREEVSQQLKRIDDALLEQDATPDEGAAASLPTAPAPAPSAAPAPSLVVVAKEAPPQPVQPPVVTRAWWFWSLLAGTLIVGAAAGFLGARGYYGDRGTQDRLCGTLGCLHE